MNQVTKDDEAAAFYEDPGNLEPAGEARRRSSHRAPLSTHVPIRFSAETIARVKELSDEDGVTVSAWVRRVVEREAERRLSSRNMTEPSARVPPAFAAPLDVVTVNRRDVPSVNVA